MCSSDNDFETLPSSNPLIYMFAGAMSGVMEHVVVYPFDVVKTRIQCSVPGCKQTCTPGMYKTVSCILKTEGFSSLYRGMLSVSIGAGPAHAAYYSIYEYTKRKFSRHIDNSILLYGISGVSATFSHDIIMNPAEVVKQRLQACPKRYTGLTDCFRKVLHQDGFRGFYRSFPTQLLMNIPQHTTNFIVYEYFRKKLIGKDNYNLSAHLISGGLSGGAAGLVTTPLDVIKTNLNVQDPKILEAAKKCDPLISGCILKNEYRLKGIGNTAKTIYKLNGITGFFNGAIPRVLFNAPSCAISWSVYETFKYLLTSYS